MRNRLKPGFKEHETARVAGLSNAKLLEETLQLAGGDDYDGCFTREGEVTYALLDAELYRRLKR